MLKLYAIGFIVIKSSSIPGLTIQPKCFNAIEIRSVCNVVNQLEIWIIFSEPFLQQPRQMNCAIVPEDCKLLANYILTPNFSKKVDDICALEAKFTKLKMNIAVKLTDGTQDHDLWLI